MIRTSLGNNLRNSNINKFDIRFVPFYSRTLLRHSSSVVVSLLPAVNCGACSLSTSIFYSYFTASISFRFCLFHFFVVPSLFLPVSPQLLLQFCSQSVCPTVNQLFAVGSSVALSQDFALLCASWLIIWLVEVAVLRIC